jgi:hypothetical protein
VRRRQSDKGGLDLIEEGAHLLRTAPSGTLATYYVGAIPFVLGFLYFWADMSSSPFANQHLAEAALAMTALFVWMKFCQSLFARRLRAQLNAAASPPWTLRQSAAILLTQATIQPSALFVIPLAAIVAMPFAWICAFYQNVTVMADADSTETSALAKNAWKQACLWPGQNHVGLFIVFTFGLCVFVNVAIVSFSIPTLVKMLFGVETTFSRSPLAMLNTTFFAAIFGVTYLCVDPLLKALYVLRCFYGESLLSGEDLKADLKRFAIPRSYPAAVVFVSIALSSVVLAGPVQSPPPTVSPDELNRRIDEVIRETKYTWRMPRENAVEDSEKGVVTRFVETVARFARDALRTVVRWIAQVLRQLFGAGGAGGPNGGFGSMTSLLYLLLVGILLALIVFLVRLWRQRNQPAASVLALELEAAPDVADENVGADQLPEDAWTRLARELLERGDFRLSMRAFYLASLAHLAKRNLIGIARFKSNRDYENELLRRAHAIPELLPMFRENISTFERIWYGMHEVNRELVWQFAANVDKIKSAA